VEEIEMRSLFLMLCLTLLLPATASAAAGRDPLTHFFNETFGNYAEELVQAREQGKKGILVFYEMDECPFCHFMKQNVLSQPMVQEYYREHFLNFAVDIGGDIEIADFAGKQTTQKDFAKVARVRATPVIAFYDLDGKEVFRHTGRTSGVDEFMLMGRFIAEGLYRSQKFTNYKREHLK
jgi:thioredoxin-related protein